MKDAITRPSAPPAAFSAAAVFCEAEVALNRWGVQYGKRSDGTIVVPGYLNISNQGLTSLPDLRNVEVGGGLYCQNNQLASLKGAPRSVGWDFYCYNNNLTSLEDAPRAIGGTFYCVGNKLTSLAHVPADIKRIVSDFGDFPSWDKVPEKLRVPPRAKEPAVKRPRGIHIRFNL